MRLDLYGGSKLIETVRENEGSKKAGQECFVGKKRGITTKSSKDSPDPEGSNKKKVQMSLLWEQGSFNRLKTYSYPQNIAGTEHAVAFGKHRGRGGCKCNLKNLLVDVP